MKHIFAMPETIYRRVRSHPRRTAGLTLLSAFILLNLICFLHVRAMTHFVDGGSRTLRPEELSLAGKASVLFTGVRVPRPQNGAVPSDAGLDFSVEHSQTVDGINLEAWYVPESVSPPRAVIALFHGYASSKASWLSEASALHEMGCAAILVDFRGSRGSTGNVTTLGFSECADVVASCALADRLAPNRPLILYGRSMGSVALLRAIAVAGVRPAGIVLECPFDRLLGTVRHRFSAMGLPSFPCAELLVFWGGVQHGMNGFAHNPVEYAASVTCPALFRHGAADSRVSVAEAKAVFDALSGDKSLEVFTDLAHESYFRARPESWRKCVTEFLDARATSAAEE